MWHTLPGTILARCAKHTVTAHGVREIRVHHTDDFDSVDDS